MAALGAMSDDTQALLVTHLRLFCGCAPRRARACAAAINNFSDPNEKNDAIHLMEILRDDFAAQDRVCNGTVSISSAYDCIRESEVARGEATMQKKQWMSRLTAASTGGSKGGIRCRKCGDNQVAIQQKQTRSADEGMTVFCTCEHCGFQWRMA